MQHHDYQVPCLRCLFEGGFSLSRMGFCKERNGEGTAKLLANARTSRTPAARFRVPHNNDIFFFNVFMTSFPLMASHYFTVSLADAMLSPWQYVTVYKMSESSSSGSAC